MKDFAVAIFGPTGVGKTSLALKLAKNNGEIISVDSMQVYKHMDIGTAKPSSTELSEVKHHLIDIITPDTQFTAGNFKRESQKLIPDIIKRNKIPFLVGGTGLYFLALMRGMIEVPKIPDEIRDYTVKKWEKIGQERFYKILLRLDEEYAEKIHPNDKQRSLRAMEVLIGTGKRFSSFLNQENKRDNIDYITIGINIDRQKLYNMINKRVDIMIKNGLIEEVEKLRDLGYKKNDPGLKAIGYKEVLMYLNSEIKLDDAVNLIKKNTRRYAKRQLTWFRKAENVKWFDKYNETEIENYIVLKLNDIGIHLNLK